MERHQQLYADAVDPLDIATVLERSGVGPQTADRFRHTDVFSLAEELHARVPRRAAEPPTDRGAWRRRSPAAALAGGALVAVALVLWVLRALTVPVPVAAQAAVFAAVAALTVGRGLRVPERLLLALGIGGLLALAQSVGPPQLALAAGAGLAEWSARWFRHLGWAHVRSRSTREFRSRMRPVLPTVALLHLAALAGLTEAALALLGGGHGSATAPWASTAAVWTAQCAAGAALLVALLLRHAERTPVALLVLAAACGCGLLARAAPTHPGSVAWAGAVSACVLLPCAWRALLSPTAHRPATQHSPVHRPTAPPEPSGLGGGQEAEHRPGPGRATPGP